MKLHAGMEEVEFIKAIDADFYFETEEEYEEAAHVGCSISDNAALMIGYELATGASFASHEVNLRLLDIMERERPSPVILAAVTVVRSLLEREPVAKEDALRLLTACREHSNAWNGLGIVLCADRSLEPECERIMAGWRGTEPDYKDH